MATTENFIKYVCEQIEDTGNIRYRRIVNAINGADITKLTVNGVDYRDKLVFDGGTATFTVNKPDKDLEIEVEFN